MATIVTLTLNPCIDISTSVTDMIPEKKLQCTAPKQEPGGGGINVARALQRLGESAIAVYPAGGETGTHFTALLHEAHVPTIVVNIAGITRENIVVLETARNQQFRFGMPGPSLTEADWKRCLDAIASIASISFLVLSGNIPLEQPASFLQALSDLALAKQAPLIIDTSNIPLKDFEDMNIYLLKPNLHELSQLAKVDRLTEEQAVHEAQSLIRDGLCEIMVVSMGEAGALLVMDEEWHQVAPPKVDRKSTVGAGDSMVAGIVHSLMQHPDLYRALQYGVACGTAATMNAGTELCHKADVDRLLVQMQEAGKAK